MEIDPVTEAGAVRRAIETAERDGTPMKLLIAERTYPTTMDDLWDALTNAERIPRWFLPITGELRPGGRYQLEGNAGGEVLACDPPRRFEVTWEYGGDVSWVTVELRASDDGDGTVLELRHHAPVSDEMAEQFGPGAVGIGWEMGLMGLGLHVASGETVTGEESVAWQGSPNAHDFIRRSSAAWAEASIASGTDPAAARAAADRVTEAYTATE